MKYDLCCLGSALVDITFQIDDDFVEANEERGIAKGGMTLIEKDDQINLIQELRDLGKSPDRAAAVRPLIQLLLLPFLDLLVICLVLFLMMTTEDFTWKTCRLME